MTISSKKITGFAKKVADLADKPNQGGLSAAQVKAQFDSSPEELRVALNGVIDILLGTTVGDSGASNIGSEAIAGVTGATVHDQLKDIKTQLNGVSQGALPDGSIIAAKYADASVTAPKLAPGAALSNLGYTPVDKAGDAMSGNLTVSTLITTGLSGATAASRYVGGSTSGAPTIGTFAKGDYVIDQSGQVWICSVAGTPGTWKKASITIPEAYIPLWSYSGFNTSTSATTSGSYAAKGTTALSTAVTPDMYLHQLSTGWPTSTQFAFEASLWASSAGLTVNAMLRDFTVGTNITSSQITTTAARATTIRSGQFSLTPGNRYGITLWVSPSGTANLTDANLIVFPV